MFPKFLDVRPTHFRGSLPLSVVFEQPSQLYAQDNHLASSIASKIVYSLSSRKNFYVHWFVLEVSVGRLVWTSRHIPGFSRNKVPDMRYNCKYREPRRGTLYRAKGWSEWSPNLYIRPGGLHCKCPYNKIWGAFVHTVSCVSVLVYRQLESRCLSGSCRVDR
jgi:hypothetical protein